MKLLSLVCISIVLSFIVACKCCSDVIRKSEISYHRIKRNAKSTKSVITRARVANVAKCKDFAERKRALAFNFDKAVFEDPWEANCVLLHCPETNRLRELVNATGVDYYSTYPNNTRTGNATLSCVDGVGLFAVIFEKENFTNARVSCQKINGILADVTSETRTRGLAKLIGDFFVYVGLSNESKERLWKNELGERISCTDYRAWDVGEPSHSRGCAGLFRGNKKNDPVWKVVPCSYELPYICEIPHSNMFKHNNNKSDRATNPTQTVSRKNNK